MAIAPEKHYKIRLIRKTGMVASLFAVFVAFLLLVNFIQSKVNDPIHNKTLPALVKRLSQNPADENLKAEIRAFDLMARKAFFTNQWQVRTGSYLLLLSVLIAILCYRTAAALSHKLEEMERIEKSGALDDLMARKWLLLAGGFLVLLALISGLLTQNMLNESGTEKQAYLELEKQVSKESPVVDTRSGKADSTAKVPDKANATQTINAVADTMTKIVQKPVNAFPSAAELRANWPFFRGAEGIGVGYQKKVPVDWDGTQGKNIKWKVKIPKPGFSSPIIWGNKIFLTGADAQARMVYCIDKGSGKIIWEGKADQVQGSPTNLPKVTSDTGLAASTMATDGQCVCAIFATGDVIAFDMDGKRLWARNLGVPDNHYGHSSSLIIYKDKLLVQFDTNKSGKLLGLSVKTGETIWETARKSKISWSSPALVNTGKRIEVILSTNPSISSYNPETGKELWSIDCLSGEVGPSVGYADGMVFAANEYAKLVGIKLGATPSIAWELDEFLPEVASPLAIKGLLFVATSYGVLACFDAKTGAKAWSQEYGDAFYGSPVYADGKVYITNMAGKTYIIQAAKEYQLVGIRELGEKSVCSPVFAEGRIFLRGMNQLYCIGTN